MSDTCEIRNRKSAAALAIWLSRPGLCGLPSRFRFCGSAFAVQPPPLHHCRLAARALAAQRRKAASHAGHKGLFAPCLIAAKPGKPCDGGVFRAFYLLLKKERCACNPKAPKSRKPAPATALALENQRHAFHTPSQALTWPPPGLCRLGAAQPFCCPTFIAQLLGLASARLPQKPRGGLRGALGRFLPRFLCVFSLLIR